MAIATGAAVGMLTGRVLQFSSLKPQANWGARTSTGRISCPSQNWGKLQPAKGKRSCHQKTWLDNARLQSSFKGEAVKSVAEGLAVASRQGRGPVEAALPALLLPTNIAATAPSFLARLVGFYVLLQAGITKPYEREVSEDEKETKTLRATKQWRIHNNSILQRKYRCASPQDGRKKLRLMCDLLSEDDTFKMSDTHKGCQVRRESAHSETVCCNGVRVLYDDNPFARMKIEISRFPEGRVGMEEYYKAEKLEQILLKKPGT